ncbi:MAG TPA: TIR domain-containing protein [Caulobacteraceae bacterium]|nr:TIR domain-containing protein [Caulobacteraceae bacterium]
MSEVFVSYARSTEAQADSIAQALNSLGYEVWRDDKLPAHRPYSDVIDERLKAAKAVLVIWSKDAAASQWVRAEADVARLAGKLVQVAIDRTMPPLPFNQIHCVDLSRWSGDVDAPEWRTVLSSIAELMRGGSGERTAPSNLSDPGERSMLALPVKPSIAVLPMENLSGDPEQEYFADALTEDIVTALSRWRWFFVIAWNSSLTYKGVDVDVKRIGRELGVRYVLEGSIRRSGDRVRVTAQLVDAANGSHLWADRFDRELIDILALQDEITEQVVAVIEPAMLHTEGTRIGRKSLTDYSALDCFHRGMWHLNKVSPEGYREALNLFREAIRRDPELSLGHIGLARILYGGAIFGWSSQPIADLEESRGAAQTAISLDPRDATAWFASAGASLYLGDHRAALDGARRAIMLNPNFAFGHYRLGQALIYSGRPAEAIAPIERCLRFSPYDPQLGPMLESLALAHYQARNYEEAVHQSQAAVHLNHSRASMLLAASLAQLGRLDEAAKALPRVTEDRAAARQPMIARYADPAFLEHLREGMRLARLGQDA